MKKIVIFSIVTFFIALVFVHALAMPVQALDVGTNWISNDIGIGNSDPRGMVARVINVLLAFLGIVAVLVVLFGGFKWKISAGDEAEIATAKKIMWAGLIGLIIILSSWGITKYVLENLINATGN